MPIAPVLAQHGGRLPEPGQTVARDRQRGVRRGQHPAGEVKLPDRPPEQVGGRGRVGFRPASRLCRASVAPAIRIRSASSGVIRSQTPGMARATKAGAKLKNEAVTTAALAAPSGAARPAK